MTTEDDFQAALDARPDDFQTRLVFADWLQERADPRAEGYRALGAGMIRPDHRQVYHEKFRLWCYQKSPYVTCGYIAGDWLDAIRGNPGVLGWRTRREAEDAAARAFARLSTYMRAILLDQPVGV